MTEDITTPEQAIAYLETTGETISETNVKWQARGFQFFARQASQMLSAAGLIEYARNERTLRQP